MMIWCWASKRDRGEKHTVPIADGTAIKLGLYEDAAYGGRVAIRIVGKKMGGRTPAYEVRMSPAELAQLVEQTIDKGYRDESAKAFGKAMGLLIRALPEPKRRRRRRPSST